MNDQEIIKLAEKLCGSAFVQWDKKIDVAHAWLASEIEELQERIGGLQERAHVAEDGKEAALRAYNKHLAEAEKRATAAEDERNAARRLADATKAKLDERTRALKKYFIPQPHSATGECGDCLHGQNGHYSDCRWLLASAALSLMKP